MRLRCLYLCQGRNMSSSASQFMISRRMRFYMPNHQIGMWEDSAKPNDNHHPTSSSAENKTNNMLENVSDEMVNSKTKCETDGRRSNDKVLRRLAQNREAARKSRIRKKAYIQQLESSHIKLGQLERELQNARKQDAFVGGNSGETSLRLSAAVNPDVANFEVEYANWVEEQNRQICELRAALQQNASDIEIQILVESGMNHYTNLFLMKATVTKSDVFYVMSGIWKTAAERCFLWVGGFRPSELLKVLSQKLDNLTEEQMMAVYSLQKSCQQAEDALAQGMERLQQTLSETLAFCPSATIGVENYMGQMAVAMGKLEALVSFVNQADHLRQQTLYQMRRILTTRQAARALLVLGEYIQCLQALSSLWAARPREPA